VIIPEEKDLRLNLLFDDRFYRGAHLKGLILGVGGRILPCARCGYQVNDPYGLPTWALPHPDFKGKEIKRPHLCTTCDAADYVRWKEHNDREQHASDPGLPPARCDCDFLLPECEAHRCTYLARSKSHPAKVKGNQGSLF
jgi:hypothetical protein